MGSSDVLDEDIGEVGSVEWEAVGVGVGVVLSGGVGGPVGEGVSVGWGVGPVVWEVGLFGSVVWEGGLCAGGRGGGLWVCGVGVWASGDVGCRVGVG